MRNKFVALALSLSFSANSLSDCVHGAKDKAKYSRLNNHTVILSGGYGSDIMVKTFCFIYGSSSLQVLKDDFCNHDTAVLYIDGEVCDARKVNKLD